MLCALCGDKKLDGSSLTEQQQLLLVIAPSWEAKQGSLRLYERESRSAPWVAVKAAIPVVLGKSGLAWGIGLHPTKTAAPPLKREGDKRSPAGMFSLGSAFGFASSLEMRFLNIEYFQITDDTEAVDDPHSHYYNHIVNTREVSSDWHSSEKMSQESLYKLGLIVNHNFPNPQKNAGSAIFLHIWKDECTGTAGCTAMSEEDLSRLLSWLDRNKNPILVQLPFTAYCLLQDEWGLPSNGDEHEIIYTEF